MHEDMVVGIMVTNEVAVAIIMATDGSRCIIVPNTNVSTGTKIIPPPTPSRPAKSPARMPDTERIPIIGRKLRRESIKLYLS